MAKLIASENLSLAWLEAMEYLRTNRDPEFRGTKGRERNLTVVMASGCEDPGIRALIEAFMDRYKSARISSINRVADTIFPVDFYHPELGPDAENHVYWAQREARKIESRAIGRTYFDRMIDWPTQSEPYNQIKRTLEILRDDKESSTRKNHNKRNANKYELGTETVNDAEFCLDGYPRELSLRTQCPGTDLVKNVPYMGFPCLSHISLTLFGGTLNLTAIYRNQHFLTKAYGNYVGLRNLHHFLCQESGYPPGELVCLATHADGEFGTRESRIRRADIHQLLDECRAAVSSETGSNVKEQTMNMHLSGGHGNG